MKIKITTNDKGEKPKEEIIETGYLGGYELKFHYLLSQAFQWGWIKKQNGFESLEELIAEVNKAYSISEKDSQRKTTVEIIVEAIEKYYFMWSGRYIGNAMEFWRKGNAGYTSNIEEAQDYSETEIKEMLTRNKGRNDKAFEVNYIKKHCHLVCDSQYIDREKAFKI